MPAIIVGLGGLAYTLLIAINRVYNLAKAAGGIYKYCHRDGSKKIGRKLSKNELKAGLDALWNDGRVEGALAEIEGCFKGGGKFISDADRLKINAWEDTLSDELYLKYKNVFDNPKYYNQKTGRIR